EDALGSPETDSMIDNGRATNALSLEDRNCRVMRRAGAAIRVDARDQVFALREIAFCEFIAFFQDDDIQAGRCEFIGKNATRSPRSDDADLRTFFFLVGQRGYHRS